MLQRAKWFVVLFLVGLCVSQASAQGPGGPGDRGRGGPGGFGDFGGTGSMGLLLQDDVRKELEIVDEQVTKLKDIGDKLREEVRSIWGGLRDIPEDQREA